MDHRPVICCVIPAMRAGGAERVMAGLCNHLSARGRQVVLVTLAAEDEGSFYPLAPDVHVAWLDRLRGGGVSARLFALPGRFLAVRRTIRDARPDAVIAFLDTMNITVLLATRGLGIPVIVSERIDPAAHRHRIGRFKSALRRLTYRWAERVVVQTRRAAAFFTDLPPERLIILPNPVPLAAEAASPESPGADGRFCILGVGRLDRQKGFDLLVAAFARIAGDFPDWDMVVYGEGSERRNLEDQIEAEGLVGRVRLQGVSQTIAEAYAAANLFAFPSRYEGFPNALAEAMAAGLPAVAFDGVSGVEDLAVDGETALLARHEDVSELADRLVRLMADPPLRKRLGNAASGQVSAFAPAAVYARWEGLLSTAVTKPSTP